MHGHISELGRGVAKDVITCALLRLPSVACTGARFCVPKIRLQKTAPDAVLLDLTQATSTMINFSGGLGGDNLHTHVCALVC